MAAAVGTKRLQRRKFDHNAASRTGWSIGKQCKALAGSQLLFQG